MNYAKIKIDINKKCKKNKNIVNFTKNLVFLLEHIDYLIKNKLITQEIYIQKMYFLNEIQIKIKNLDLYINKKKYNKEITNTLVNDIYKLFQELCCYFGSSNCKNTLDIYLLNETFLDDKDEEYIKLFNLYNEYFIPISSNKINNVENFLKIYGIKNLNLPCVISRIYDSDIHEIDELHDKINCATIIFKFDNKIICINGFFKNDSLDIFKNTTEFKNKLVELNKSIDHINVPTDFKERYVEQISLKDFIILNIEEIISNIKDDYNDFLTYKDKSLSILIKEFIKSPIEKQRKIILLFLICDKESQFTAHIIFDLINDKSFSIHKNNLSENIFNSFHWKIQKIFKILNDKFEDNKKKLNNLSINNVPYEVRILSLKVNENIQAKAMEKLKEINGSKENSIKAQQWLDGFLKIPFNTFKKEPIIDFFKKFINNIEEFIDLFTIKISEYECAKLNIKNQYVYNIIIEIIDEYHSIIYKSENSFNVFIKYLEIIKISIEIEINSDILKNINTFKKNITNDKLLLLDSTNTSTNIDAIISSDINDTIPSQEIVDECMNQLTFFKKIKTELFESNLINKNNLNTMIKKLHELELMLNVNLIKNKEEEPYVKDSFVKESTVDSDYNIDFINFISKILIEFGDFIKRWNNFKTDKKNYMIKIDTILEKCTYGQNDAKMQMKRIIGQWMNGNSKGQCFGLHGPPGVGKTTLCKNGLAKCLFDENGEARPFAFLPLGGATNGSILEGHHYTYLGSTWGKIVDILMETKCMNPIIYIDELDKISKTEHGKEIISILTHITDQSQNKEYYDRYFASIPIDLSQVLFIFSYNDRDSIDRILIDRIQEINIKALSVQEKLVISQNYMIPEILTNVGFAKNEIIFDNNILKKIINQYTFEAGVRKLIEILYDIIRDINLKKITNEEDIIYPVDISIDYIDDFLSNMAKINIKKINDSPKVGLCNGLYATKAGLGGLTIIQVMRVNSDKKFVLEKLTGSQGDVMKESMNCAMTLAWNIIPDKIKKEINNASDGFGLHIHCPDGGTPKDGPSAGLAITMGIISRLTNIPIKHDLALTGEVDLVGDAHEIGGLYSKITGAYNSDIKTVLIPRENKKDLDIIFKKEEDDNNNIIKINKDDNLLLIENNKIDKTDKNKFYFRNSMEIILVDNIFDVLKYGLIENDLEFNQFF